MRKRRTGSDLLRGQIVSACQGPHRGASDHGFPAAIFGPVVYDAGMNGLGRYFADTTDWAFARYERNGQHPGRLN